MRALRKIIFLNSAHIRYAEVRLDGNVHFIGTQGVGKSTLLRAILFFYNAHKTQLGIPQEKKSFDEFYLPHANSYIIYEVEHEHGPFSIVVCRALGRACYRFIDTPFKKEWFVDEYGEVTAEYQVIRSRLDGAYMSKLIDKYEQYLNILYGNRQAVDKEFARFQLMETSRYQNIYLSIQNVFLNSRLEANFIKEIIIRSMSEEEANFDLGYFRRQVADFEQEYKDISCWFKTNQKGESVVKKMANDVVKTYHDWLYMQQQIEELCGELKYAIHTSRKRLPLVEKRLDELNHERERLKVLIDDLLKGYENEKSQLNQKQGVVNEKLQRLKQRKDFYAAIDIETIIRRCSKEQSLKIQLISLKERLSSLTAQFNDVTSKYKTLCQGVTNHLEAFCHAQRERILALGQENQAMLRRLFQEYEAKCVDVDGMFAEKLTLINEKLDHLKAEDNDCEKELVRLQYFEPYKEELTALQQQESEYKSRKMELTGLIASCLANISSCQAEFEKKTTEVKTDSQRQQEKKQTEIDKVTAQIGDIDQLLSRIKGSLYEWLEDNKKDWERNIGKVVNEEEVLYRTGLNPSLSFPSEEVAPSFYGITLDLTDLPLNVRKPKQLQQEKKVLEESLQQLQKEKASLLNAQEEAIENLQHQFTPKMKELRQKMSQLETEQQSIPKKLKSIAVKKADYEDKAKQHIATHKQEQQTRRQEIAHKMSVVQAEQEKVNASKQGQLAAAKNAFNEEKDKAEGRYRQQVDDIKAEIKQQEAMADAQLKDFKQQEEDELKGCGVDTSKVKSCEAEIKDVNDELKYIDAKRKCLYDYQRDKEELFDREEALKNQQKNLSESLQQLADNYTQHRENYESSLSAVAKEINERKEEQRVIHEGLKKADAFMQDERLCPAAMADAPERQTLRSPAPAVEELTSLIVARQKHLDKFKQSVNVFKGNFSTKNTFHFRMELATDEDYLDFANNLDEFLINNKLEEYRRRTSERYTDILTRVSKEMGELTRHESDVEKIIHEINNDFKERNFVGVIKLIALQPVPSSDKMVQLMKRIKEFHDEHQFAMGEMNLFSTDNREEVNNKAVDYLLDFMRALSHDPQRQFLTLSDLFQLQFRIVENDNDTGWADRLSHVGSEGTDTLVKAMINIMLINVFKEKVSKRFGDFRLHCMMDEIGKLHPQNVKGILNFANARNILLINSSPTTYNVSDYRYTYLLSKDNKSNTVIHPLISQQG